MKIYHESFSETHAIKSVPNGYFHLSKGEQPDPPFDDSTEDDEIEDPSDPVPDLGNVQINTQPTTYVPEPQQPTQYQPPQQPTQSYQPEPYQQEKIQNPNLNWDADFHSKLESCGIPNHKS